MRKGVERENMGYHMEYSQPKLPYASVQSQNVLGYIEVTPYPHSPIY